MSMIDFLKKHEKVLGSGRDSHGKVLHSLKVKLEELHSMKPNYQEIADEIYGRLEKENLIFSSDEDLKLGDEVLGIGKYVRESIEGLKGKVADLAPHGKIGIEWERRIYGGHDCRGRAKLGHGLYMDISKLKKVSEKPEIKSRKDYDDFLESMLDKNRGEYLDYDDKDFKIGDEVEFHVKDLKGKIGVIVDRPQTGIGYYVDIGGKSCLADAFEIAKVKKRKTDIIVGDEVEVVNAPNDYTVKDGSWGHVIRVYTSAMFGKLYEVKFEEVKPKRRVKSSISIEKKHLRLKCNIDKKTRERINLAIKNVEEDFELPEFENKAYDLSQGISDLLEKEIISVDEMKEYFTSDILTDLELNYDEELEELLK